MKRTHYAGQLREEHIGQKVYLCGWVQRKRNLGSLIFVDLRDREGLVQLVFDSEHQESCYNQAQQLGREDVIQVEGTVARRSSENPELATGSVEIIVDALTLFAPSEVPPIHIRDDDGAGEDIRLKYRYLDLRKKSLMDRLRTRSKINAVLRNFLIDEGFIEFETPILTKTTPEGARDYLVPSRVNPGKFYALPQSPQIFKQLLMIGGADRYFQITRCFRDEDLRADRQPEFTQLDIEMSFVDQEDILAMNERLMQRLFKEIKGIDLKLPLKRLSYLEALERYGSDKPDTRFDLQILPLEGIFAKSEFKVFAQAIEEGKAVRGIFVEASFSGKQLKNLEKAAKTYGAMGLAHVVIDDEISGSIARFLSDDEIRQLRELSGDKKGIYFIVSDRKKVVQTVLGNLRNRIARDKELFNPEEFDLLWIVDFPAFEYDEEEDRFVAQHHPFTNPKAEQLAYLDSDPSKLMADCYDLVINGFETASGSIRIHDPKIQAKIFEVIGFTPEAAKERFGFFIDALRYGTPPHGGIAYGLDRLAMILTGTENIRDVIAFPKTLAATCLMSDAPSFVEDSQLEELSLRVTGEQDVD